MTVISCNRNINSHSLASDLTLANLRFLQLSKRLLESCSMNNTFNIALNNNGADRIFVSINGEVLNEYKPDGPVVQERIYLPVPPIPNHVIHNLIKLKFFGDGDGKRLLGSCQLTAEYTQSTGLIFEEKYTLSINKILETKPFSQDVSLKVNTENESPSVLSQNDNNVINILASFSQS